MCSRAGTVLSAGARFSFHGRGGHGGPIRPGFVFFPEAGVVGKLGLARLSVWPDRLGVRLKRG
eukprot:1216303-Lingulodinium_polyedra.AAC.1